jgi:hypothetical protein
MRPSITHITGIPTCSGTSFVIVVRMRVIDVVSGFSRTVMVVTRTGSERNKRENDFSTTLTMQQPDC